MLSKRTTSNIAVVIILAILAVHFWGSAVTDAIDSASQSVRAKADEIIAAGKEPGSIGDSDTAIVEISGDYVVSVGQAKTDYEPGEDGVVEYCPVDDLGRAVCAYGYLTSAQREAAQARDRQDITTDPSGWSHNAEVTIPALESVTGSKVYSGWFWNRSHLVADSLGGDPDPVNLVTGTRTQNVGSTQTDGQYSGGMAYTETLARDYLDSTDGDSCPLYYAATPVYTDDELVPRTVIVDMQSCDKQLDMRVEVTNAANGWTINYSDGSYTKD